MAQSNSVVCIGELLIDFFCTDINVSLKEGSNFLKQAGGAPANVSAAIAKLGGKAAFVGKVGSDPFGEFLVETIEQAQVDTSMILKDPSIMTTMAYVSLQSNGERDFVFSRGADEKLFLEELDIDKIQQAKILHFGSATALLGGESVKTYFSLMQLAKENNQMISFDPNYRDALWATREKEFIELAKRGIALADFVKVSEEELVIITGEQDLKKGVQALHQLGGRVITVTLGSKGTFLSNGTESTTVESVAIKSIDSTGAGDAFVGATLYQFAQEQDLPAIFKDFSRLEQVIQFSNKVGALVCTKMGAIAALPSHEEIKAL